MDPKQGLAMFGILEDLHQREESGWTRLGRMRSRQDGGSHDLGGTRRQNKNTTLR